MPDTVSEVSDQIELAPDVAVLSSGDRAVAFTTSKDGYYLVQVKIKPSGLGLRDAETLGKSSGSVPPTIAALRDETADLLVVFVDAGGVIHTKQYTARTSTWSELTWRGGHTTDQQVALTTLDHGRAVVAYRSNSSETAGRLFTSFFNPDDDSWSFPEEPVPDIHIVGSPALTRGVGAGAPNKAFVELAYVLDSSTHATGTAGTIHHARCIAMPMNNCTSWTMPERIGDGTDYSSVAIASMPMTARPD
ncbi:hypothetical protein WME90_42920 [Sorangium sp. So ce375]|uniref:hypothetical protein n=1 Tax=Sorangium sp. So ce375 TaxID=3133306 RepID=UPI003F5CAF97